MTKAISNWPEICFIKAVLLLCEHWHFLKKKSKMVFFTPPPQILSVRVNKSKIHIDLQHVKKVFNFNRILSVQEVVTHFI